MSEAPSDRPRRGLGAASLVLALIPYGLAVVIVLLAIGFGVAQPRSETSLGILVIGLLLTGWLGILLGLLAVILGIAGVVRRSARGKGIAGIVLGAIAIVVSIPTVPGLFYTF